MDLQHIRLRAVDAKGRTVLTCQDELTFAVSGDAQIVAVTNGDINSNENITLKTSSTKFKQLTTKLETK